MQERFSPTIRVDRVPPVTSKDRLGLLPRSNPGIGVFEEIHLVHTPSVLECVISNDASGVRFEIQPASDDFIFKWASTIGAVRPDAGGTPNLGSSGAPWGTLFTNVVDTPLIINGGSTIEIGDNTQPDTIGTLNLGGTTNYWLGVHTDIMRLHGNAAPVVNGEFRLSGTDVFVFSGGASRNLSTAGGSGAPDSALYVTLSTNATLTAERVLTGTTNQITITDNGAGSTVVLSTPQNVHTGASPTFAGLTLNGTLDLNSNDIIDLGDIGFDNSTDRLITMGSGGTSTPPELLILGFDNSTASQNGGDVRVHLGASGAGGVPGAFVVRDSADALTVISVSDTGIIIQVDTTSHNLDPIADDTHSLGTSSLSWQNLFLTSQIWINETVNTNQTTGITILSETIVDQVFAAKASGLAHGFTALTETDTAFIMRLGSATLAHGGMQLWGLANVQNIALQLFGHIGTSSTADTTKSTSGNGVVEIIGQEGGGFASDSNLLAIKDDTTTRFIFDIEGSGHADVEFTTFDEYKDWELAGAMTTLLDPSKRGYFKEVAEKYRPIIEKSKLITYNDDGHHFVNFTKLPLFCLDMGFQLGQMYTAQEQRIQELETKVLALTGDNNG